MGRHEVFRAFRVAVAVLFVAPVLVLVGPGTALACSCAPATTAELVGFADTVAVGELVSIEEPTPSDGLTDDSGGQFAYTATLQTVLKGDPENPLVFRSTSLGSDCFLNGLTVGLDYVFFLHGDETGLCDGTAPVTKMLVADIEAVTGAGRAPDPSGLDEGHQTGVDSAAASPAAGRDGPAQSVPALWVLLGAGGVALLLIWGLTRGRRSSQRE